MKLEKFDRSKDTRCAITEGGPDAIKGYTRHGFQFIIRRNHWSGALLGYIRVPKGHPWYKLVAGKRWKKPMKQFAWGRNKVFHVERWGYHKLRFVDVHGGLTYGGRMLYRGHMQRGWWIGFEGSYKTVDFVRRHLDGISTQMKDAY